MNNVDTVTIERWRYDELIAKEERLALIEQAIKAHKGYCEVELLKKIFNLGDVEK